MRDFEFRRRQTGDSRERIQDLLEREILSAEKIAFADPAFVCNKKMTGGAFFHADEIQTCFNVARHLTVEKIENDFSGGRGFPVPWADRRCRHRNDCGKALLRCVNRKSTRLNSSHSQISYAVFCLK